MKALLLLLLFVAPQSDPVLERVLKEGKGDNRVMDHLDHLSNRIGPRLTGSANLTKACEWTKAQFESWGLRARMEEWGTFPVGFERGPWSARMSEPEAKELTIGTNSWTAGTAGPVTAPAVLAPSTDAALKEMKESLKGAWVISTSRGPDKYQVAYDEAGIAGIIKSMPGELILTGGNPRIEWEKLPKRVTVNMIASQHKAIVEHLKAGKKVTLTIDISNRFVQGPVKLYNVIADIPGTEKPDEFVIFGGQIDSWDGATGTTDNGTGISTTMEAARLLAMAGAKPKRTIRFMLWSGEEQGLLGSRAYVKAHPEEMKGISAVFVHDMGTNYLSGIPATEAMFPIFEKVFKPAMELDAELKFAVKKSDGLPRMGGSDHFSFLQVGVPGLFWEQGRTKEKGQTYSREHHTQHDVYSTAIPEFQKHSAMVVAIAAWGLANLEGLLPREGLVSSKAPPRGRRRQLGVECEDDLVLGAVYDGSVAAKAGLKPGDKILKFAGKDQADLSALRDAIQKAPKETKVVIKRDGKEVELPVVFTE